MARIVIANPAMLPGAKQALISALLAQAPGLASGIAIARRPNLLLRRKS